MTRVENIEPKYFILDYCDPNGVYIYSRYMEEGREGGFVIQEAIYRLCLTPSRILTFPSVVKQMIEKQTIFSCCVISTVPYIWGSLHLGRSWFCSTVDS